VLWLSAVLIAAVSNLDNLAVGFAFGMRDTRIAAPANVVIAAVTMAGTAGAMTSGRALSRLMPPAVASVLGSLIIIAIGAGTIVASLHAVRRPATAPVPGRARLRPDRVENEVMSGRKALALGIALSLNNVGSGVGAGVAGVSPLATTLLAGVLSLICVGGGSRVGWSVGRIVPGQRAPLLAGLVLLGVGAATLSGAR
jgi:putative Mn2+ efflux pump MntP